LNFCINVSKAESSLCLLACRQLELLLFLGLFCRSALWLIDFDFKARSCSQFFLFDAVATESELIKILRSCRRLLLSFGSHLKHWHFSQSSFLWLFCRVDLLKLPNHFCDSHLPTHERLTAAGLAYLRRILYLSRMKDPIRNPTVLCLLILRTIIIPLFETKSNSTVGFFLNLILTFDKI